MPPTPHLPDTIDAVIARLETIVDDAIRAGSRVGYFAALYHRVTTAVRDGVRAGAFEDNARMERLDVVFANRYIEAYDVWRRGETPTVSWKIAFASAERTDLSVLQHLFLGMNAHINLDLGIAAVEVAPGDGIHALQNDFNHINGVLAALMPTVEGQLREMSPCLDRLTTIADGLDNLDDRIGNFSITKARDGAWRFALRLASLHTTIARNVAITARDAVVAQVGLQFQQPGPMALLLGGPDGSEVAAHLRVLSRTAAGLAGA